jgi:hypothetical protein
LGWYFDLNLNSDSASQLLPLAGQFNEVTVAVTILANFDPDAVRGFVLLLQVLY